VSNTIWLTCCNCRVCEHCQKYIDKKVIVTQILIHAIFKGNLESPHLPPCTHCKFSVYSMCYSAHIKTMVDFVPNILRFVFVLNLFKLIRFTGKCVGVPPHIHTVVTELIVWAVGWAVVELQEFRTVCRYFQSHTHTHTEHCLWSFTVRLLVLTSYIGHREASYTITWIWTETKYCVVGNPHLITLKMHWNVCTVYKGTVNCRRFKDIIKELYN